MPLATEARALLQTTVQQSSIQSASCGRGITPLLPSKVNSLDHLTAQKILQFIGQPPIRMVLWDGSTVPPDVDKPVATLYFRDRASLYLTLLRPELYWGDLYSEGRVEVVVILSDFFMRSTAVCKAGGDWAWLNWMNRMPGTPKNKEHLPQGSRQHPSSL